MSSRTLAPGVSSPRRLASPIQCRAARALLNWSQARLGREANVTRKAVLNFEEGGRVVHLRVRMAITCALERAGIEFQPFEDGVYRRALREPPAGGG